MGTQTAIKEQEDLTKIRQPIKAEFKAKVSNITFEGKFTPKFNGDTDTSAIKTQYGRNGRREWHLKQEVPRYNEEEYARQFGRNLVLDTALNMERFFTMRHLDERVLLTKIDNPVHEGLEARILKYVVWPNVARADKENQTVAFHGTTFECLCSIIYA